MVVVEAGRVDAGGQERVALQFERLGSVCLGHAACRRPVSIPSRHVYVRLRDSEAVWLRDRRRRHIAPRVFYVMRWVRDPACVTGAKGVRTGASFWANSIVERRRTRCRDRAIALSPTRSPDARPHGTGSDRAHQAGRTPGTGTPRLDSRASIHRSRSIRRSSTSTRDRC